MSRLGRLVETAAGATALAMTRLLPRRSLLALGATAGAIVGRIDRRRTAIARQNLEDAYGDELPEDERERIVRACWRHFGRMALDAIAFPALTPEATQSILRVEGLDRAREALAQGRGLLVFSAHFGQWEAGIAAMRRLGVPLSVIVRPLDNPALDRRMMELRGQAGVSAIPKRSAMRESLRALADGHGVVMLIDQDARHAGVFVPYFGRPASTTPALALLALRTKAPILPVATMLSPDGTIAVHVEPPVEIQPSGDRDADVVRVTAACTAIVERWVRSKPEQWLWMHRRWKSQP
jgi:KDO2-lipid IV(A) lauroyltransferase